MMRFIRRFKHNPDLWPPASMRKWHKPQRKVCAKIVSLLVSLTFVFPYLTWAFEPGSFHQAGLILFNNKPVEISKSLGTITQSFTGDSRLVVHVQDLHCNYEVQTNIAKIIDSLAGRHGLNLVGVEGAALPINVTRLSAFPLESVKRDTADYLVKQGRLTGAELYAALGRHAIRLEGIESPDLYEANWTSVMKFLNNESQGYICDLREMLDELKNGIYNGKLAGLDHKQQAFRQGNISLLKYAAHLYQYGRRQKLNLEAYPNLKAYVSKRRHLFSVQVDGDGLFRELDRLDRVLRSGMYTDRAQEEMDVLQRRLDIMEKLLNISAAPEELARFRAAPEGFRARKFLDYIARHNGQGELRTDAEVYVLDRYLEEAKEFYRAADERSLAFVENVLGRMEKHDTRIAMLVTGGFHTDEMASELKARGVSYVCVKPRIKHNDIANPYFDLLRNQRTPLEKLLAQNQNILALRISSPQSADPKKALEWSALPKDKKLFYRMLDVLFAQGMMAAGVREGNRTFAGLRAYFRKWVGKYVFRIALDLEKITGDEKAQTFIIPFSKQECLVIRPWEAPELEIPAVSRQIWSCKAAIVRGKAEDIQEMLSNENQEWIQGREAWASFSKNVLSALAESVVVLPGVRLVKMQRLVKTILGWVTSPAGLGRSLKAALRLMDKHPLAGAVIAIAAMVAGSMILSRLTGLPGLMAEMPNAEKLISLLLSGSSLAPVFVGMSRGKRLKKELTVLSPPYAEENITIPKIVNLEKTIKLLELVNRLMANLDTPDSDVLKKNAEVLRALAGAGLKTTEKISQYSLMKIAAKLDTPDSEVLKRIAEALKALAEAGLIDKEKAAENISLYYLDKVITKLDDSDRQTRLNAIGAIKAFAEAGLIDKEKIAEKNLPYLDEIITKLDTPDSEVFKGIAEVLKTLAEAGLIDKEQSAKNISPFLDKLILKLDNPDSYIFRNAAAALKVLAEAGLIDKEKTAKNISPYLDKLIVKLDNPDSCTCMNTAEALKALAKAGLINQEKAAGKISPHLKKLMSELTGSSSYVFSNTTQAFKALAEAGLIAKGKTAEQNSLYYLDELIAKSDSLDIEKLKGIAEVLKAFAEAGLIDKEKAAEKISPYLDKLIAHLARLDHYVFREAAEMLKALTAAGLIDQEKAAEKISPYLDDFVIKIDRLNSYSIEALQALANAEALKILAEAGLIDREKKAEQFSRSSDKLITNMLKMYDANKKIRSDARQMLKAFAEAGLIEIPYSNQDIEKFYANKNDAPLTNVLRAFTIKAYSLLNIKGKLSPGDAGYLGRLIKGEADREALIVLLDTIVYFTYRKSPQAQDWLDKQIKNILGKSRAGQLYISIDDRERLIIEFTSRSARPMSLMPFVVRQDIDPELRVFCIRGLARTGMIDSEYAEIFFKDKPTEAPERYLEIISQVYNELKDEISSDFIPPGILVERFKDARVDLETIRENHKAVEALKRCNDYRQLISGLANNEEWLLAYYCFSRPEFIYPGVAFISFERFKKIITGAFDNLSKVDDSVITVTFEKALIQAGVAGTEAEEITKSIIKGGPPLPKKSKYRNEKDGRFIPVEINAKKRMISRQPEVKQSGENFESAKESIMKILKINYLINGITRGVEKIVDEDERERIKKEFDKILESLSRTVNTEETLKKLIAVAVNHQIYTDSADGIEKRLEAHVRGIVKKADRARYSGFIREKGREEEFGFMLNITSLSAAMDRLIKSFNGYKKNGKLTDMEKKVLSEEKDQGSEKITAQDMLRIIFRGIEEKANIQNKILKGIFSASLENLIISFRNYGAIFGETDRGMGLNDPVVYLDFADKRNIFEVLKHSDGAHSCRTSDPKINQKYVANYNIYKANADRWSLDMPTMFFQISTRPRGGVQLGWLEIWLGLDKDGLPFIGSTYIFLAPGYQSNELSDAICDELEEIFRPLKISKLAQLKEDHISSNALMPPDSYEEKTLEGFRRLESLKLAPGENMTVNENFLGNEPADRTFLVSEAGNDSGRYFWQSVKQEWEIEKSGMKAPSAQIVVNPGDYKVGRSLTEDVRKWKVSKILGKAKKAGLLTKDKSGILEAAIKSFFEDKEFISRENLTDKEAEEIIWKMVKMITGKQDLLKEFKDMANRFFIEKLPDMEEVIKAADDPLKKAVEISAHANLIGFDWSMDLAVQAAEHKEREYMEKTLNTILYVEPKIYEYKYEELKSKIESAKNILYLLDNAGEVVFDLPLMKMLGEKNKEITIVAKDSAVYCDVTFEDAVALFKQEKVLKFLGQKDFCRIIPTGSSMPGIDLRRMPPREFNKAWEQAGLIVSKGEGNHMLVLMNENNLLKEIISALVAKEPRPVGLPEGARDALVIRHSPAAKSTTSAFPAAGLAVIFFSPLAALTGYNQPILSNLNSIFECFPSAHVIWLLVLVAGLGLWAGAPRVGVSLAKAGEILSQIKIRRIARKHFEISNLGEVSFKELSRKEYGWWTWMKGLVVGHHHQDETGAGVVFCLPAYVLSPLSRGRDAKTGVISRIRYMLAQKLAANMVAYQNRQCRREMLVKDMKLQALLEGKTANAWSGLIPGMGLVFTVRVMEKGVGSFSITLASWGLVLGGLAAMVLGLPVIPIALAAGLAVGALAWIYARRVGEFPKRRPRLRRWTLLQAA